MKGQMQDKKDLIQQEWIMATQQIMTQNQGCVSLCLVLQTTHNFRSVHGLIFSFFVARISASCSYTLKKKTKQIVKLCFVTSSIIINFGILSSVFFFFGFLLLLLWCSISGHCLAFFLCSEAIVLYCLVVPKSESLASFLKQLKVHI